MKRRFEAQPMLNGNIQLSRGLAAAAVVSTLKLSSVLTTASLAPVCVETIRLVTFTYRTPRFKRPAPMAGSWTKHAVHLPILPPEVWSHIFRFASLVPGIFDAEIEDPFGPLSPGNTVMYNRGASEKRAIRTSLVTKRYLVRVCKQWHALAMPFLYESIYIGFWHVAPSLRDTLVESEQRSREDPEGRVALGWWTRRLDVAIRTPNKDVEQDLLESPGYLILVDIIRCLPRLEVFSSRWMRNFLELGSPPGAPSPIAEALKQTCCASLRRIYWPHTSAPQHIDGLLAASPSLVTLSRFENHHRCPLIMPFCPTLTYLSLPTCVTTHARRPKLPIPYPCLRQISLHDSHEQSNFLCLDLFLAWQGRTVTTVYIFVKYFLGALHPSVLILNRNCPNLQHLVVVFRLWSPLPASTQLLTATHLGLYLPDQGCNGNYRMVFEWLGCISSSTLKVVRLMNRRGFEDLCVRHRSAFVDGCMVCSRLGLRLEDPEGEDVGLTNPSSVGQG